MSKGGAERTYSIWGLIALFALIGLIGLLALLLVAFPRGATTQVAGPATPNTAVTGPASDEAALSAADGGSTTTTDGAEPSDDAPSDTTPSESDEVATPPTLPGGAPAPEGVRQVLRADGATSFTFDLDPAFPVQQASTAVAPTRATPSADGSSITAAISCAVSSQEALGQLSVSETPTTVTVVAVVLVPPGGAPCEDGAPSRELTIPLAEPLGARSIVVVPAGTPISGSITG